MPQSRLDAVNHAFVTPCVHLGARSAAFTPRICTHPCRTRPVAIRKTRVTARISLSTSDEAQSYDVGRWRALRRIVEVSAVSLGVMMCALRPANSTSSGSGQVTVPRDAASDVEAAALTLGAVTVGGLVMRAVLASRRDEDKEREKLAAECARLEQEEIDRARRLERKAMEKVEGDEVLPEDDALQSSLLKRLNDMKNDSTALTENTDGGITLNPTDEADKKKNFMRNSPLPDRGTGSMLLDRPNDTPGDNEKDRDGEQDIPMNQQNLEMLNRMWKMDSADDDKRKP